MLDELFPRREAAKKKRRRSRVERDQDPDEFVLRRPRHARLPFLQPGSSPTRSPATGREILLWSKRWFEAAGFTVLYGDTDSLFVHSHGGDPQQTRDQGRQLASALNGELARYIGERWGVPSRLELEFEKLYLKLFLPRSRHSTRGASKRYVGLRHRRRCGPSRVHRHGGRAPGLDRAGQAGAARTVSTPVCRPSRRGLSRRCRAVASGAASSMRRWCIARTCARTPRTTPRPRRPMWSQRANQRSRRSGW